MKHNFYSDGENADLMVRLNRHYKDFSKGHRQIASYIIENYDRAAFITASKLGSLVGVSESTVVRFANVLGYDGYPELQSALQEIIRNKLTSIQRIQLTSELKRSDVLKSVLKSDITNIRTTVDSIDNDAFNAAIDLILGAGRVYIIGLRSAAPLALFLSYYLGFIHDNVFNVNMMMGDTCEGIARIGEGDVCIGMSFPRYSARTVEMMEFAKKRSAKLIAITDSVMSPIAALADESLIARSDMASFADSLVAPLSLINAIIVACTQRSNDDVYERFNELENIWDSQRVYLTKEDGTRE